MSESNTPEGEVVAEAAPPSPYGSIEVQMQVERAHAIGREQGGSVQAVRRDPETGRWWVTIVKDGGHHVFHWTEAEPQEALIAGSPFPDGHKAYEAVEAMVASPAP